MTGRAGAALSPSPGTPGEGWGGGNFKSEISDFKFVMIGVFPSSGVSYLTQMKLAFSTSCCSAWDLATLAARIKPYGFDGLEISAGATGLDDAPAVRKALADAGSTVATVACPAIYRQDRHADQQSAQQLIAALDRAAALGAAAVLISDPAPRGSQTLATLQTAFAGWLRPAADHAAKLGVQIVLQNVAGFRTAGQMWHLIETINHPSVQVSFNPLAAALVDEPPSVSVPVLNTRIRHVRLTDAKLPNDGTFTPAPLLQGDLPLKELLTRLAGIGYQGWLSLAWPSMAGLPDPAESLPAAATAMIPIIRPPAAEPPKAKAKPKEVK